jgi:hypothetical protein
VAVARLRAQPYTPEQGASPRRCRRWSGRGGGSLRFTCGLSAQRPSADDGGGGLRLVTLDSGAASRAAADVISCQPLRDLSGWLLPSSAGHAGGRDCSHFTSGVWQTVRCERACVPRVEHPTKSPMRENTKFPELPRRPWRPTSRAKTGAERYPRV